MITPPHRGPVDRPLGPEHTSEMHQFKECDDDDLCNLNSCRGTREDPIHCPIGQHHDGPCYGREHSAAIERRRASAREWSAIERRDDGYDFRDYLNGEPVHCGAGLDMQAQTYISDNYGEFRILLPTGVSVRYELAWGTPRGAPPGTQHKYPVLHTDVGGFDFTARAEPWMRFRWPARR